MRTKASTRKIRQTYEFIKANRKRFDVRTMCRVLEVAPSGYYAWIQAPVCQRALEDVRLLRLIRASFTASHGICGAPRVFLDLREAGETCSKHRVMRLMRVNTSYLARLALPRCGHGFVLQKDRRVVDTTKDSPRAHT